MHVKSNTLPVQKLGCLEQSITHSELCLYHTINYHGSAFSLSHLLKAVNTFLHCQLKISITLASNSNGEMKKGKDTLSTQLLVLGEDMSAKTKDAQFCCISLE